MIDVVIIGAGISGACVARELSKYPLSIVVLDKENDVADGTTKANSAIIHAGFDAKEGSLMAKYNVWGNRLYKDLCAEIDAPYRRTGSYVLAFSPEEDKEVKALYDRGIKNSVPEMEILDKKEILKREPNISPKVTSALYAGTAAVVDPMVVAIKLLENAAENGADILTDAKVTKIERMKNGNREGFKVLLEDGRDVEAKIVINAAGVHADEINNMLSSHKFKIIPRKGEYYILDKNQGNLTDSVIFQCPTKMGKGILVAQTIHGNLMVGPTALDVNDKENVGNTIPGLDEIRRDSVKSIENINFRDSIRNFAGLRAESDTGDFIIGEAPDVPGFFNIAGMKSPGLSSAPAIGIDIAEMIAEKLGNIEKKDNFIKNRPQIHFMDLPAAEKEKVIKKDPKYGRIICRCESITEGEIIDSIRRKVGAKTVDGVKKRCRPGMGRCQGGFCGPRVMEILSRELNKKLNEIVLDRPNAYILTEETKKEAK